MNNKPQTILFKYTSRSRKDNFFRGLDSIVENLANKENYWIQCTFDLNDKIMFNAEVITKLNTYKNLSYYFGESKSKIDAINKNLDKIPPFDILVNMSDDMVFMQQGFDDVIRDAMNKYFPNNNGFLHFHDNAQPRLATLSIIGVNHFNKFGFIYHSDFISVYCDNWAQDVAQILKEYKYMGDDVRIFKHLHPAHVAGIPMDDQYRYTESFYNVDKETYIRHKKNNYGL